MKEQIHLCVSEKYKEDVKKLKMAIIEREGNLYPHFQEYIVQAIRNFVEDLEKTPVETQRGNNFRSVSANREIEEFLGKFESNLKYVEEIGMREEAFKLLLHSYYPNKSDKTIRDKRDKILRYKRWTILKVPGYKERVIISKKLAIYRDLSRWDISKLKSGQKETVEEKRVFNYLKKNLLNEK